MRQTSVIGLLGDLRSTTLGLLSFGVLLAGLGDEPTESESAPGTLSWRAVRGVAGDFFCGVSGVPFLLCDTQMNDEPCMKVMACQS